MIPKVNVSPDLISGDVDEGYGKVADVFRRNFDAGKEIGAAVAVYRDGCKVVDLWGGYRDGSTQAPWEEDTIALVFSTTKGVASLAVAVAVSRGLLSYDAKVADYWPEFAQAGKEGITVRQLLSHQAGLPFLKPTLTRHDLANPTRMTAKLEAQRPVWSPGTRQGYHAITLGWYTGELIRRTDPEGRSFGQFFADEVAKPLDLDYYIGLPASVDRDRVAKLHIPSKLQSMLHLYALPPGLIAASLNPFGMTADALTVIEGVHAPSEDFNGEYLRAIEMPAGNGIGTARSIAKLYGSAATGGSELGLTPDTLNALKAPAIPPTNGLRDKVVNLDMKFALGFSKPDRHFVFGSSDTAFGTAGLGGSGGFADPDTGVGFSYVMNKMGFHFFDPRQAALRDALFHDVLGSRHQS
ncbi:EstA family serine hydrolase [Mycobacterium sp. URHB0044]|uniref:EstA family serine hydrolase n=1 Tax=Mycobacterium sp. URHB0044 TaxID=1380386 RepID=UPI0004908747|nr:EstA family serine hydrolase [Mycobacterium sp. URHB0044]